MPTYEYICRGCDHEFEQFQSMKDRSLRKCPKCGKNALERKIGTGGAVIFKGSGFYQTDYRSESYKKAADAEKKPASDGKAETPKSDAKTETAKSGEGGKAAETKKAAPAEGGSKRASGKRAKT